MPWNVLSHFLHRLQSAKKKTVWPKGAKMDQSLPTQVGCRTPRNLKKSCASLNWREKEKRKEKKEVGQSDQPGAFGCVHHVVSYCTGQFAKKKRVTKRISCIFFYLFQVATLLRETGDVVCQRFNRFKRFGPFLHLELSDLCANFRGHRKSTTAGKRKRHRQKQASISGCFFLPKHDQPPPRHFRLVTGTWKRLYGRTTDNRWFPFCAGLSTLSLNGEEKQERKNVQTCESGW